MDLVKLAQTNDTGKIRAIKHSEDTVLVTFPGGFDPKTGEKLPDVDVGYPIKEVEALRVQQQAEVDKEQAKLDAIDGVLAEVNKS